MRTQDDLAAAAGLSVPTISLAERGKKVEPQTLRLIELALDLPDGTFESVLEGRITDLEEARRPQSSREERGRAAVDRLLSMSHGELAEEAALYEQQEPGAGDAWMRRVLEIRRKAIEQGLDRHDQRTSR